MIILHLVLFRFVDLLNRNHITILNIRFDCLSRKLKQMCDALLRNLFKLQTNEYLRYIIYYVFVQNTIDLVRREK